MQALSTTDIIQDEHQQLIIVLINWHFQQLYCGRTNTNHLYWPCRCKRSIKDFCILNRQKGYINKLVGIVSTMNHHFNNWHFPQLYHGRTNSNHLYWFFSWNWGYQENFSGIKYRKRIHKLTICIHLLDVVQ